jgi:hypothetical protein
MRKSTSTRSRGSPFVLVHQTVDALAADDRSTRGCRAAHRSRWVQVECPERPAGVVVVDELVEDAPHVTLTEDVQPVQALAPHRPDPPLGMGIRARGPVRGADHVGALGADHVIERAGNVASRSRTSSVGSTPMLSRCRARLRACWVTHAAVECAVQPAMNTRRVWTSMQNGT